MKVLVTGITGMAGSHLAEYCATMPDVEIHGTKRWRADISNITEDMYYKINFHECDLRDQSSVMEVINNVRPDKIFHLAAQSFVKASWQYPHETFYTNIMSQCNIFEAVRQLKIDPVIHIAGCYDTITKAYTRNGFKGWNDIIEGDEVLSINPKNREVSFKKVKRVIVQENYSGDMYHFESKSLDLFVTPNHRMVTTKAKQDAIRINQARELTGRNIVPLGKTNSLLEDYTNDECYIAGIFIGDGFLSAKRKMWKTSGKNKQERMLNRNKDGRWETTGVKEIEKEYISTSAFFCVPDGDKARDRVRTAIKKLGYPNNETAGGFYITPNDRLRELLEKCGRYAANKTIPTELLNQKYELLKSLFIGLIDSDGNYRDDGLWGYTTISDGLKDKMVELCHKLSLSVTFSHSGPRNVMLDGKTMESDGAWNLSISTGEKILTKGTNDKKLIPYYGTIWCVEVEDNGTLLVERNGRTAFCGNSSEEYGMVPPDEAPIKETNPLRPLSPYGVSKIAQDLMGWQYYKSYGLKIIRTRAFNHEGPRRGHAFVTSNFALQIARAEMGITKPVIYVGNLTSKRDYTDVRDMVRAYWIATEKCVPGEVYNVCSGNTYTMQYVLDYLVSQAKIPVAVEVDPARLRPSDVQLLWGDNTKFVNATGWKPEIPLEKTLSDTLDFWRDRLTNGVMMRNI